MNFRREPIRSRKLLDSAKGQPCDLQVPGVCNHDPATTVSCHVRDESFGMGVKADDCSTFHGCAACHAWFDRGEFLGTMNEAEVLRLVLRAMQRTMRNRIERGFIRIDLDKPKPLAERKTPPRLPKELRAPVGPSRPLQSASNWPPKGSRKIQGRAKL